MSLLGEQRNDGCEQLSFFSRLIKTELQQTE